MGFGLAICKRIIEAHGGKIDAESVEGKGTTIIVQFPTQTHTLEVQDAWV
jgi:signal transduction histidine kinase